MTDEIIDVDDYEEIEDDALPAVAHSEDLTPVHPGNLFNAATPEAVLEQATAQARVLKDVIVKQGLSTNIQGKEHVNVEGWTTLGSMLGVFPVVEWVNPLEGGKGYVARVEARTLTGAVVGAAEAICSRDERSWKNRDDYALASMAQTRATSKALRLPLGFVMQLAGYSPTPAEEMTFVRDEAPLQPGQTRTTVTEFPTWLMSGADRLDDGSFPRVCPACKSDVEQKEGTSKKGKPYSMWKCTNRDCQGGDEKRDGGRWPWGSFSDDPWRVGGEIDDELGIESIERTDVGFDPKAAMHAALSHLSKWDDKRKGLVVRRIISELSLSTPLSQKEVEQVASQASIDYYDEHPDQAPFT